MHPCGSVRRLAEWAASIAVVTEASIARAISFELEKSRAELGCCNHMHGRGDMISSLSRAPGVRRRAARLPPPERHHRTDAGDDIRELPVALNTSALAPFLRLCRITALQTKLVAAGRAG